MALDERGIPGERCVAILPGQYFDAETGLHQNGYRDYDPSIGRYLQSDPLGLAAGANTYGYVDSVGIGPNLNLYAYAANNPVRFTDRMGLCASAYCPPNPPFESACTCTIWCTGISFTPMVRCERETTCVDNCGNETRKSEFVWFEWSDRPFVLIGRYDCGSFPGGWPGYF